MLNRWSIIQSVIGALLLSGLVGEPGVSAAEPPVAPADAAHFEFTLDKASPLTSAGIYDSAGKLVRVLWTMKPLPAGKGTAGWDGRDEWGKTAPPGPYSYHIVLNDSTYRNIGTIGNTGKPTNTSGHVPINFESVAVDREGNVYTVHDWDEPHFDVIKWSPTTGYSVLNSGHPIGGLLKAVAVDDSYAYVTAYENLNDPRTAKFYISRLRLKPDGMPLEPFTTAGNSIPVYNGAVIPAGTPPKDAAIMGMPLLSLAVDSQTLYATDALAGKVHRYNKVTGVEQGTIDVHLPQAVALAPDGRIWVGHEHGKVSVFDAMGSLAATPITDCMEINALAFSPDGRLYIADQGIEQVKIYRITGNTARPGGTFGQKALPGDRAPDHFFNLHGLAIDRQGNIITAQNEFFFNGGRLAKFSPAGKPLWEQMGLEFQSMGSYGEADPDTFYTFMHHTYHLDRKTGGWTYLGNSYTGSGYHSSPDGVPRVVRVGQSDFYYMPSGNGMQIFRIQKAALGKVLFKLASIVGSNGPGPAGTDIPEPWRHPQLWSWHDEKGDNTPHAEDLEWFQKPDTGILWQYGAMSVDSGKNIWFTSADRGGVPLGREDVWMIPVAGRDKLGNPIYHWADAKEMVTRAATSLEAQASPDLKLKFTLFPKMTHHADDATTYIYGNVNINNNDPETTTPKLNDVKDVQKAISDSKNAWLHPPTNGGLWMGGNTLSRYSRTGEMIWSVLLPEVAVGFDVIPGGKGGCMVGGEPWKGGIHHYTSDGLLIGKFYPGPLMGEKPNNPSGLLDAYIAVSVARDSRDRVLDVFVEDDYNCRIAWYRVDDRKVRTVVGPLRL